MSLKEKVNMRTAAYMLAVKRVADATTLRVCTRKLQPKLIPAAPTSPSRRGRFSFGRAAACFVVACAPRSRTFGSARSKARLARLVLDSASSATRRPARLGAIGTASVSSRTGGATIPRLTLTGAARDRCIHARPRREVPVSKEETLHLANALAEPGVLDNVEDLLTDVITSPRFDSEVFTLERSLQVMLGARAGATLVGLLTVTRRCSTRQPRFESRPRYWSG